MGAMIGFAMIPLRRSMKTVRYAFVALILALHMVMKAPVWHLLARTDLVGGSTGWHRAHVIDKLIAHTSEWILFGTANLNHWEIYGNDICNHYCLEAVRGGGPSLALLIIVLALAFGNIGRAWKRVEASSSDFLLTWAIGVSIFVHTINFVGVGYFGQNDYLLNISLAMTSVVPFVQNPGRSLNTTSNPRRHPRAIQTSTVMPTGYR